MNIYRGATRSARKSHGCRQRHKSDSCLRSPHRKQPTAWFASGNPGKEKGACTLRARTRCERDANENGSDDIRDNKQNIPNYDCKTDNTNRNAKRKTTGGWILLPTVQRETDRATQSDQVERYSGTEGGARTICREICEEERCRT